jgi:hypothetical protein
MVGAILPLLGLLYVYVNVNINRFLVRMIGVPLYDVVHAAHSVV